MAKKRTIIETTIPDPPADTIEGMPSVAWDSDEDILISKIKERFGGSLIRCKVYKIIAGKANPVYCFESEEDVSESDVQERFGGGKYAIRYLVDNTVKHTQYIEVAEKPTVTGPNTTESIQNQMLREQSQFNRDLLMTILGRANPVTTQTPMHEIATMWGIIHGTPNNNGNGGGIDKFIDILKLGMELGGKGGGDMDWKTALVQTAKEVLPAITSVVAGVKGIPLQNPPASAVQLPPESILKSGIDFMKAKILAGLPVGLALDWVIANANEYREFLSLALAKDFQEFVTLDNELANEPFNSWFRQLLVGLKEHFKEQTQDTADNNDE